MEATDCVIEPRPASDCDAYARKVEGQPIGCDVEIIDRGSELFVRALLPVDARECVSVSIAGNVMTIRASGPQGAEALHPAPFPSLCQSFCLPLVVSEHNARVSKKDGIVEVVIATGGRPSLGVAR